MIDGHGFVDAFVQYVNKPRSAAVYNMGGGRFANCSMLEAISLCEEITGKKMNVSYADENRSGDHIWWISDTRRFERDFPAWRRRYDLRATLLEIHEALVARL